MKNIMYSRFQSFYVSEKLLRVMKNEPFKYHLYTVIMPIGELIGVMTWLLEFKITVILVLFFY